MAFQRRMLGMKKPKQLMSQRRRSKARKLRKTKNATKNKRRMALLQKKMKIPLVVMTQVTEKLKARMMSRKRLNPTTTRRRRIVQKVLMGNPREKSPMTVSVTPI